MANPGPYTTLPLTGPHPVGVGHALITMVEPHVGYESNYNRWYEDDHMFSGALYLPWMFSARRWVATWDLQQLRLPKPSSSDNTGGLIDPLTKGCYLSTYWITPGRIDDHKEWSYSVYQRLVAEGRGNDHRDHAFTSFQDRVGTIYLNNDIPNEVFTLLDPSPGLVLEIVDAPSPDQRDELEKWLLESYLPSRIKAESTESKGSVSSAMVFRARGPDIIMSEEVRERVGKASGIANDPTRLTILWFLTEDPRNIWDNLFGNEPEFVSQAGKGEVRFLAPFIPAKMGTTLYEDQLRKPDV